MIIILYIFCNYLSSTEAHLVQIQYNHINLTDLYDFVIKYSF